ncbi:hypothetical protein QBK99_11210 [Corticibacterium sp. UT-5YL-CI-8]|nr:hypothetical protein [Tianweitania sp. UT-5YL-CI-8]
MEITYLDGSYACFSVGLHHSDALGVIMKPRIRVKAILRPASDPSDAMYRAQCEAAGVPADAEPRCSWPAISETGAAPKGVVPTRDATP